MQIADNFLDVWNQINDIQDWQERGFSWPKARVASLFAKIAYLHVPEYELRNADRANLIPCASYRDQVRAAQSSVLETVLQSSDLGEFFVVERPYAIAVGVRIRDVVFVSFRGTQKLHDWSVNLNAIPVSVFPHKHLLYKFHRGFYRAALSCLPEIETQIYERFGEGVTIYVTGHSLGGALAAITHALWAKSEQDILRWAPTRWPAGPATHSCYSFGMPRYGNLHAVHGLPNPFSVSTALDIVPKVPPRLLGFEDAVHNYSLSKGGELAASSNTWNAFPRFIYHLATMKVIREHDIEEYMSRLELRCTA